MKIGFLSFAHMHAASYAPCLQQIDDVEIVGIYDDDDQRGQEVAERFAVPFFSTAESLLDQGLDGVIICSENVNHRPLVELAAAHTDNILCEKPIATTLEDAQAIIDCCEAANTRLQIAFPVRFAPAIQNLKSMLDQDKFGQVLSAKCTNHGFLPGRWFVDKALSGGGAVIDHTVHVIDVLRWFWDSEVVEVYAEIGDSLLHPGLGIDDAGLLSFQLENGIYGTLDTSWSRPASHPIWGDVKIEITGKQGVAYVDALNEYLSVSSDQVGKNQWVSWGSDMDFGLIQDFVGMIREERPPSITGYDGLKALEVALAAYESARVGRPIKL